MPFFPIQSFEMHYEVHEGIVDKDTLAIHGNLASNAWWEPTIEVLKKQSQGKKPGRFIAAEWRGCGKSQTLLSEKELSLPILANDYNELLKFLNVQGCAVIGHSTGGLIALHSMRSAPSLYSRALLLDPVGATGVQFGPEMYEAFTAMSKSREICAAVMTGTISKSMDTLFLNRLIDDAFHVHPLIWHGVAKMLHSVDFRPELAKIQQPVLVLHGELDAILKKEDSLALAKGLPQGKFLELPSRGHSSNVEDPDLFVDHINRFLFG